MRIGGIAIRELPARAAEPSSFRNIAIRESGGSGSHGSSTRKTGVSKFNNRIWARPNVVRRRIFPFNHQATTPVRLNFSTRSNLKPAAWPTAMSCSLRVAPAMPEHFVQGAEKLWAARNQHHGGAAVFQRGVNVAQRAGIIGEMFEHIQENHGVKGLLGGKRTCVGGIHVGDAQVRAIRAQPFESAEIFGIEVRGPI